LRAGELALEELAPAADGAEGVTAGDGEGRIRGAEPSAPCADSPLQRLVDVSLGDVGRLRVFDHLRTSRAHGHNHEGANFPPRTHTRSSYSAVLLGGRTFNAGSDFGRE